MWRRDNDYQRRIDAVRDYVAEHPGSRLSLERLAGIANFSQYHFHRIFRSVTGEPLGRFVQRTRLQAAAMALRSNPDLRVLDVAMDHGYESADGFSRAFRQHFGVAPSQWDRTTPLQERKIGADDREFPSYAAEELRELARNRGMRAEIATMPACRVAYVRIPDAYRHTDEVVRRYGEITRCDLGDGELLGISWDDPDLTPIERCTFEWAVVYDGTRQVPHWLAVREIPELTVARVGLQGGLEDEDITWQYLYRVWLPESDYEPASAPAMEVYRIRPHETDWERLDMWCALPVVTR